MTEAGSDRSNWLLPLWLLATVQIKPLSLHGINSKAISVVICLQDAVKTFLDCLHYDKLSLSRDLASTTRRLINVICLQDAVKTFLHYLYHDKLSL